MISLFSWAARSTQDSEPKEFDKFTGICSVNIYAVNPTKAELQKIYNKDDVKDPTYLNKDEDGTESIRIDLFVKPSKEYAAFNFNSRIPYFIKKKNEYSKDGSKVRVINKYGQTYWMPTDDFKGGVPPKASFAMPCRPALVGEVAFIDALRKYLNIPNAESYNKDTNSFVLKDKELLSQSEGGFSTEEWSVMFKEDFSKVKQIFGKFPENKIKYLFGVKNKDGKEYQTIAERFPIANNTRNLDRVFREINRSKEASEAFRSIDFGVEPYTFSIYKPNATDFSKPIEASKPVVDPFGAAQSPVVQEVQAAVVDDDLPF